MRGAFVYMMSNKSHRLYIGATTDLANRVSEHKEGTYPNGFTARYIVNRLVYYEWARSYAAAVRRERALKGWTRKRKVALIQTENPNWLDLPVDTLSLLMVE